MIVVPRRNKIAGAVLVLLVGMAIVPLNGCGSRGGGRLPQEVVTVSASMGEMSAVAYR